MPISSDCSAGKQVFTTVHNNQQEMSVMVLSGDSNRSLKNAVLGHIDLVNLPPGEEQRETVYKSSEGEESTKRSLCLSRK